MLTRLPGTNAVLSGLFLDRDPAAPDAPPTAAASPAGVSSAGGTSYAFAVTYADDRAVSVASLGGGDVLVSGPNGFSQLAAFAGVDAAADGTPRVATYRVTPPGGSWDAADNGTYTLTLRGGEVRDAAGNAAAAQALGTFAVSVPAPAGPDTTPPAVVARWPAPGGSVAAVGASPTATFGEPVDPAGVSFVLRDAANNVVPASAAYDAASRTVTLDPAADLARAAAYTLSLSGARDAAGNVMAPLAWSFVTTAQAAAPGPRVRPAGASLDAARQKAAADTPQWQAFRARLDQNLERIVSYGAYQGSYLSWIADYALGYQALRDADPAAAARYADKAIALMKSGMRDYQKADWVTRQFLARGDGAAATFALPHEGVVPATVRVYVGNVWTKAVARGAAADGQDAVDYYTRYLKVSNTPDGPADYAQGADWAHNPGLPANLIDWSVPGREPAPGATYYVTQTSAFGAPSVAFTLSPDARSVTLAQAPRADQAVFVEYVYNEPAAGGLAYQQTGSGDGGFNSIYVDSTYSSRYLGKYVALGYDWLYDYAGLTPALKAEAEGLLVGWSDFVRDQGYIKDSVASNYGAGGYVSRMFTALALSGGRHAAGDRLLAEMADYRGRVVLPNLQAMRGGFWAEGWSYGALAAQNLLAAGLAYEDAGLGSAAAERQWAGDVVRGLLSLQPTRATVYNGGDWFAYPAPVPGKDLFYVLAAAAGPGDPSARAYANYVVQNYPGAQTADATDLLYRDPAAPAAPWTADLPPQRKADGAGLVAARADWSYDSTFVTFQLGNLLWADHQSYAPGQLQVQRGADDLLVNAAGVVNDQSGAPKSRYANLVAVDDNGEGAQNYRWSMGYWYGSPGVALTRYEAAAADAAGGSSYVYAGGDYRAAYSLNTAPGAGGPARELTRQVVYLRPDYVVVHDRATTAKDAYPKQLQWHVLNAPTLLGDNAWVAASGGSRLFGRTFSSQPLATAAAAVAANGRTLYRVATTNATPSAKVRYVTALQTAPSAAAAMVATRQVLSADGRMEGVQMGDQIVLFGTDGPVDPAAGAPVTFATAGGAAPAACLLTDLQPGRAYAVTADGAAVATVTASSQGTVSFAVPPAPGGAPRAVAVTPA